MQFVSRWFAVFWMGTVFPKCYVQFSNLLLSLLLVFSLRLLDALFSIQMTITLVCVREKEVPKVHTTDFRIGQCLLGC
jgi:hypothetical protein